MKFLSDVLTVDPGNHTGYAYWFGTDDPATGQFNIPRKKTVVLPHEKFDHMMSNFHAILESFNPHVVVIEDVRVYGSSAVSMASATRGDLIGLARLVGGYCECCRGRSIRYQLIPAVAWKGQMPDAAVRVHVQTVLGREYKSEHVISALGIGLSKSRHFPIGSTPE
jgi:Holliday junction resolvasome RuvABC endonuclease subunit